MIGYEGMPNARELEAAESEWREQQNPLREDLYLDEDDADHDCD